MKFKISNSLFFRFFWTLLALGVVPMAISSVFLFATYQGTISGIVGASIASQLVRNSTIQVFLILIFVFIIATFAAIMISRNISRPLSVLTEAVRRIARGNLNVNIKVSRKDEIGALGEFFNEMVAEIKETHEREVEISRLKSEFISIAAHQLRTPLSVEKWAYRAVLDGDLGPVPKDQKEILEKAYIANESMIRLVHNLLDAARIEEGRFGLKFEHVDLITFLKKLVEEKTIFARKKQIKLTLDKSVAGEIFISADPDRLGIAVGNIIDNAIRYTAAGGIVDFSIEPDDQFVKLLISDTGIGIAKEEQSRMFTKFYRGSNVVHLETEGTGLGLFITKNIVAGHHGEIGFMSEEGKGTTFYLIFPRETSRKSPFNPSHEPFEGKV